ncbi:DUF4435 domain-containing protein [Pseudomonas monteilii]|uniref:DUF4435 domain-containing protein n=1 Tax=Pseudomonas monteilii TaxID=76759 RepID=UPI003F6E021B
MSRVATLTNAASSAAVKFLEVTRAHSKKPQAAICIFEGNDEKYYACRLSSILGQDSWVGINTGGRNPVLELRKLILQHPVYKKCRFLCFIDKDYDDWLVNPDPDRIYITPCYSIENLYASQMCLVGILSAEFRVTDFNEMASEYAACIDLFQKRMVEVCECLLSFNIWGKGRALMERDGKGVPKVYLNDATIDKLIHLDLASCTILYDPNDISSLLRKSSNDDFCAVAIAEATSSFENVNRMLRYRGKQQIEAFRRFLSALRHDFVTGGGVVFKKKGKLKMEFDDSKDLLSELSQYADTPDCLRRFLHVRRVEMNG